MSGFEGLCIVAGGISLIELLTDWFWDEKINEPPDNVQTESAAHAAWLRIHEQTSKLFWEQLLVHGNKLEHLAYFNGYFTRIGGIRILDEIHDERLLSSQEEIQKTITPCLEIVEKLARTQHPRSRDFRTFGDLSRNKGSAPFGKNMGEDMELQIPDKEMWNIWLRKLGVCEDRIRSNCGYLTESLHKSYPRSNEPPLCGFWQYVDDLYRALFRAIEPGDSQHFVQLRLEPIKGVECRDFEVHLAISSVHDSAPRAIIAKPEWNKEFWPHSAAAAEQGTTSMTSWLLGSTDTPIVDIPKGRPSGSQYANSDLATPCSKSKPKAHFETHGLESSTEADYES
ncbi:hypothetical protein HJFPF1_04390 [Paramyrothecium foliicola]|nr:hypothetical protein HJFPF1_04390 [Paramyrothecium foliicola]